MYYVNLHTHKFTENSSVIEIVNQYPLEANTNLPNYSIGIHPWHINKSEYENELQIVSNLINNNECLAVGECGLDKNIDVDFSFQTKVFIEQLKIAERYNKPVILHIVKAYEELLQILKQEKISVPIVLHGFSKNIELANALIYKNIYLSFGKYLFLNPNTAKAFKQVSLENVFLETDNSNYAINEVYTKASSIKNISVKDLQLNIYNNFLNIFKNH